MLVKYYNKFTSSLPDKKQLLSLGASAVCSYGLVSNINYCGTMIASWVIHGRRTGLSPLAPGQWKEFLVVYGALWAGMNFLRPLRIWLSMFVTPFFDKVTATIQEKTGLNKRISFFLISSAKSIVGLFSSTILSCLTVNITASDQYLSIVIPGKMWLLSKTPQNLSVGLYLSPCVLGLDVRV